VTGQRHTCPTFENGKEKGESTGVDTLGGSAWWRSTGNGVRECLQFDEQRSLALECGNDDRPGNTGAAVGKEQLAGVGDADHSGLGHLEETEFRRGAETVFGGSQQAKRVVAFTLERENGVDDVFEYARPSEPTLFGDVTDHDDRKISVLGFLHESVCAATHLHDGPGG
jgi:hypothetical protein